MHARRVGVDSENAAQVDSYLLLAEHQAPRPFVAGPERTLPGGIRETLGVLLDSRKYPRTTGVGHRTAAPDERGPPGKNVVEFAEVVVVHRCITLHGGVPVFSRGQLSREGFDIHHRLGEAAAPAGIGGARGIADQRKARLAW